MTVYGDDPAAMIGRMTAEGASDFHVIDLDGARTGSAAHRARDRGDPAERSQATWRSAAASAPTEDIAAYQAAGVNGVIVGTRALTDPVFFEGLAACRNIVLGLDTYEGKLMVKGWKEAAAVALEKALEDARRVGIMALLCTNIARDGMLTGADYDGLKKIKSMTDLPVIASGGVAGIDDLKALKDMDVWAAIVGKAFYEGRIGIGEAMSYAD